MPLLDPIPSPVEHADFAALEWEPLLALVAGFAASPVGRDAILDLRPSTDEDWIARQHQLTGEVRLLLDEQVSIPLGGLFDPTQLAAKAQIPGAALEAGELQAIARLANDVASWQVAAAIAAGAPGRQAARALGLSVVAHHAACARWPNPSSAPFSPTARWPTTPRPNWAASAASRSASSE